MSDSVTVTFRPIYLEDLGTNTTLATTTTTVLGAGPGITVTPIVVAANDAGAAAAGVPLYGVYLLTASVGASYLAARMS
jgi:hypothetical protein